MGAVRGILGEELGRLQEAEKSYRKAISALPKGSIQRKRIKGKPYPYLVFRHGNRVVSRYLGRLLREDLEKLRHDIELRRKQEQLLLQVRRNMLQLKRMLHGKRRPARVL